MYKKSIVHTCFGCFSDKPRLCLSFHVARNPDVMWMCSGSDDVECSGSDDVECSGSEVTEASVEYSGCEKCNGNEVRMKLE